MTSRRKIRAARRRRRREHAAGASVDTHGASVIALTGGSARGTDTGAGDGLREVNAASANGVAAGLGRIQRLGKGREAGEKAGDGPQREPDETRAICATGRGVVVCEWCGHLVCRAVRRQQTDGRERASDRATVREGRAPRYESVATRICKLSSRAFQLLHPVTSSSPRNAQDAGVVIPFRTLKSKHDFSMSQGPMSQFLPPYLVAQDVHVHDPVVPPALPPLMQ